MSNACVLDTHAWIAVLECPERLPRRVHRMLQHGAILHVPSTCLLEFAMLWDGGRVRTDDSRMTAEHWMTGALADPCRLTELSPRIAACAVALGREGFHRDPSDRIIYATARVLDIPLITGDEAIHRFEAGLPRRARRLALWS